MNGEHCGGSGANLAIGKINSGSWQWAKQIGGQSWSLGLSDGLVFTGSNLVFAGQSWPCFFDSTKQIVIGSTTINNMNNSHYVEFFGTLSTSGTWGSVRWSGGSTNAFMGNTKISPHPSGVMLSGLYKATSYDTNFSTVSFADDEGPWIGTILLNGSTLNLINSEIISVSSGSNMDGNGTLSMSNNLSMTAYMNDYNDYFNLSGDETQVYDDSALIVSKVNTYVSAAVIQAIKMYTGGGYLRIHQNHDGVFVVAAQNRLKEELGFIPRRRDIGMRFSRVHQITTVMACPTVRTMTTTMTEFRTSGTIVSMGHCFSQ